MQTPEALRLIPVKGEISESLQGKAMKSRRIRADESRFCNPCSRRVEPFVSRILQLSRLTRKHDLMFRNQSAVVKALGLGISRRVEIFPLPHQ